jgi:hypothetical protein
MTRIEDEGVTVIKRIKFDKGGWSRNLAMVYRTKDEE